MKRVIVLFANGLEDVEAVTPVDFLRRAGVEVVTAGVGGTRIVGSRGIRFVADASMEDLSAAGELDPGRWDAVVVPGGMPGAANIAASVACSALISGAFAAGKLVAAVCAAPAVVLAPLGVLSGRSFTCYPGMEGKVSGASWREGRVVVDGTLITSRGAGTAGEWAVELVRALVGDAVAEKLAESVLLKR